MTQAIKKRPALLILVTLAVSIVSLGIFLDGQVIPNPVSSEDLLIQEMVAKSSIDSSANQITTSDQPSEVAQQLKHALDVVNQSDADETEALSAKQTASRLKGSEPNGTYLNPEPPSSRRRPGSRMHIDNVIPGFRPAPK